MLAGQIADSVQSREDLNASKEHGSGDKPASTLVLPSNEPACNPELQTSNFLQIRTRGTEQD
jgi:hypothetical protein